MTLDTVDIAVEFEGFRAVKEFHILAANENHEFGEWGRSTASQAAQHRLPKTTGMPLTAHSSGRSLHPTHDCTPLTIAPHS
jgi:hypothetical protein